MLIQALTFINFSTCLVLHKVTIDLKFRQAQRVCVAQWRITRGSDVSPKTV